MERSRHRILARADKDYLFEMIEQLVPIAQNCGETFVADVLEALAAERRRTLRSLEFEFDRTIEFLYDPEPRGTSGR